MLLGLAGAGWGQHQPSSWCLLVVVAMWCFWSCWSSECWIVVMLLATGLAMWDVILAMVS